MKKLSGLILASVMALAIFTGCSKNDESQDTLAPVTSPSPSPVTSASSYDSESDPNYQSVLALWKELDGYWLNKDNGLVYVHLDENGKAAVKAGLMESTYTLQGLSTAVTAADKGSYIVTVHCPAQKEAENAQGPTGVIVQDEKTITVTVDTSNLANKEITLTNSKGEKSLYKFLGKTMEEVAKNGTKVQNEFKKTK